MHEFPANQENMVRGAGMIKIINSEKRSYYTSLSDVDFLATTFNKLIVKMELIQDDRDLHTFTFKISSYNKTTRRATLFPTDSTDSFLSFSGGPHINSITLHPSETNKPTILTLPHSITLDVRHDGDEKSVHQADSWGFFFDVVKVDPHDMGNYFRWIVPLKFEMTIDEKMEMKCRKASEKKWKSRNNICGWLSYMPITRMYRWMFEKV